MFLCAHDFSFFKGKYIQVGLLGITLPSICLTFQETENLFSKMAILHPNQQRMRMPVAAHLQQHLLLFCRDFAIVVKVSLMGSYVQFHLALNQKQFTHNPQNPICDKQQDLDPQVETMPMVSLKQLQKMDHQSLCHF